MDHRRTILSIFVSSPSDCAEERVRALIARLDASPLAQHRRIAFSSILWEDLPGGDGAPGDAQQRIRHLLDHFGLRLRGAFGLKGSGQT